MKPRLIIELSVVTIAENDEGTHRHGVTTFHDAARVLRELARDFEAEAPGAELAHGDNHEDGDVRLTDGITIGTWRVR